MKKFLVMLLLVFVSNPLLASSIEFQDTMGYSKSDDAVIIGWVTNESDQIREYIKVVATIKNDKDEVIGTGFSYTDVDKLYPGESSPFELRVQNVPGFKRYSIQTQSQKTLETPSRDIELVDYRGGKGRYGNFKVVGEVKNTGEKTAEYIKVVCTGLNTSSGDTKIAGVGFTYTELDEIRPGGTSPFELIIQDPPRQIDRYLLKVESQ